MKKPLTCIDLFSGCGGFTLGMMRSGFQVLAAIDFDADAVETLRSNLCSSRGDETLTVPLDRQRISRVSEAVANPCVN